MYTQADFEKQYKAHNAEACNRAIRMQHQNKAQDRLLHLSNSKVERDRQREAKTSSLQKEALLKEQEQRSKLSPSIDEWMKNRASHMRNFQDRERERLMSRHGRSARAGFRQRAFSDESAEYPGSSTSKEKAPSWRSVSPKERKSSPAAARSPGSVPRMQRRGSSGSTSAVKTSRTGSQSSVPPGPEVSRQGRRHSLVHL